MSDEYLAAVFNSYCAFGSGQRGSALIDGRTWVKMCREANLFDRTYTQTDADLLFARAKQGTRYATMKKVPFEVFRDRLVPLAAHRKGLPVESVSAQFRPPQSSGTVAEYARFHDDKGTYTGVYARGGPSAVDFRVPTTVMGGGSMSAAMPGAGGSVPQWHAERSHQFRGEQQAGW